MHQPEPNINSSFFEGSYQHAWRGLIPPGLTEAETDFIMEMGSLSTGSRVLDFMCGYGRHALELGRRGVEVTAIDNLGAYIDEIRQKSQEGSLPVEAIQQDVIYMQLGGTYDAAICMGNSFAFFNREDALSILKNVSEHLNPGGVLILNSWMIAEIAIRHFKEYDWHYAGNYKCVLKNEFKFNPTRIEFEHTIISEKGKVEIVHGVDYIFTLNELGAMFQDAGLELEGLYSTPRKRKFQMGDTQIYFTARKLRPGN